MWYKLYSLLATLIVQFDEESYLGTYLEPTISIYIVRFFDAIRDVHGFHIKLSLCTIEGLNRRLNIIIRDSTFYMILFLGIKN